MNTDSDVTTSRSGAATYAALFTDDANQLTVAGAIDDETGPVAYLADLFTLSGQLEEDADATKACLLATRRPDLPALVLDTAALREECSTLGLVNGLLEKRIGLCTGGSTSVEERMANATTPTGLPYDAPWNRVLSILHLRGIPLWRAVRHSDPEFPAFVGTEKPSKSLRDAVTMGCGFPPSVREMLFRPAITTDTQAVALFSAAPTTTITELSAVKAFMQAAGLTRRDVRHLLAVDAAGVEADDATAVSLADFAPQGTDKPSSKVYGAAFINAGAGPLWIRKRPGATDGMDAEIAELSATHLDRMQRLLQVRARLAVSFADADLLICSALRAEKAAVDALPTEQTLRALGLYGHMKASTAITPAGFAALIDDLSPHAIGRTPALLDGLIKVTDKPFTAADTAALASALRVDLSVLEQILQRVEAAQKTRACTLAVLSACYRLVSLPRLLGLDVEEGLALLQVLEQQSGGYNTQIAGVPVISGSLDAFDILDSISAYWNAAEWARQHRLSFIELKALSAEAPPTVVRDAWVSAVADAAETLSTRLLDATTLGALMRGSEGTFDLAGKSWSEVLADLVDSDGLVSSTAQAMRAPDLRSALSALLTSLKNPASTAQVEDYVSALGNRIGDLAETQGEVVSHMLQSAFDLDTAQASAVMTWAGVSRSRMLGDAMMALKNRAAGTVDASTFSSEMKERWHRVHRIASLAHMFDLSGECLDVLVAHPDWFSLKTDSGKPARAIGLDMLYRLSRYRDWAGSLASGLNEMDALTYLSRAHALPASAVADAAAQLASLLGAEPADIQELSKNLGDNTGVAEDVADVDYVMRLLALQRELGISVATLRDLNAMKGPVDTAQVKSVAAGLGTTLDDTQRAFLEDTLSGAWRDALCTWLLHYGSSQPAPLPAMTRLVDLSAYLLVDVEVGSEPRTTRVAAAIASLQQYIHRLYARLEDGYAWTEHFVTERKAWRDWRSQYALWQTYTLMKHQPSGFLDPSRRSNKSSLFEAFEKLVGQGKFAADEIQIALLAYLADFERISNIQPLSGYHDGVDPQSDTFHFIGRSNVDPAEYYWRTLDMSMRDTSGAPSMLAWGEWQRITLPATGVIVQTPLNNEKNETFGEDPRTSIDAVRPVVIAGRRYVVWLERDGTAAVFDNKPSEYYFYRLCYAYLQTDGLWSTANELIRLDGTDPAGRPEKCGGKPDKALLKTLDYQPRVVVMVDSSGPRKDDPWLVALLVTRDSDPSWKKQKSTYTRNKDYYVAAKDLLLVETQDIDSDDLTKRPLETRLVDRWSRMFDDPRVVQHRYVGAANTVVDEARDERQTVFDPQSAAAAVKQIESIRGQSHSAREFNESINRLSFNIPSVVAEMAQDDEKIRIVYGIDRHMALFPGPIGWPDTGENFGTALSLSPSKPGYLEIQWKSESPGRTAELTYSDRSTRKFSFRHDSGDFGYYSYETSKKILKWVSLYDSQSLKELGAWVWHFPPAGKALKDTLIRATDSQGVELARFSCEAGAEADALTSEFLLERSKLAQPLVVTVTLSPLDTPSKPYATRTARLAMVDRLENDLQPDDGVPSVTLRCNTSRVHSLDFTEANSKSKKAGALPPSVMRMNTLFGKRLVALATQSVQHVLTWRTQTIDEPTATAAGQPSPIDFGGCNGVYFWELFFHVPWLVAWRLRETRQFRLAETWCARHLFDPQRGLASGDKDVSRYWNAVPLTLEGGALASQAYEQDPDALANFDFSQYRRATFLFLVELWLAEGDSFFRQMTRDALVEAWLSYEKALRLIGRLPEPLAPERWRATELKSLPADALHAAADRKVTQAHRNLVRRMGNLRHGLTLDGKPGFLAMYQGDTILTHLLNPRTGSSSQGRSSRALTAPGFRYGEIMPRAKEAVAWLSEMGKHLFHIYEAEFDADLAVMQQKNLVDLHRFTIDLQKNALVSAQADRIRLERARDLLRQRKEHFEQLVDAGLYHNEAAGFTLGTMANFLRTQAGVFGATEKATELIPNIFGMAVGGSKTGAIAGAARQTMEYTANIFDISAQAAFKKAEFDRRAAEWKFEIAAAKASLSVSDSELAIQDLAVTAAALALDEAETKLGVMRDEYVFMTTGFAIGPTYHWMITQLTSIYSTAYDAVFALCLDAEAAYQRDTGDFGSDFVSPAAWSDTWKGMLGGESLQRDLLALDSAYLRRHERRMLVERDISLAGIDGEDGIGTLRQGLTGKGFTFSLRSQLFDQDYPGHYLRQIQHVSVTLVLDGTRPIDPTCHVPAVLTQISSTILTQPDEEALRLLYEPHTSGHNALRVDVRASQQTAVSTRTADVLAAEGYGVLAALLFSDGRLLPFEGTGAISTWRLELPGNKATWKAVLGDDASRLRDVIFRVKYTARDGGGSFAAAASSRANAVGVKLLGQSPRTALATHDGANQVAVATGKTRAATGSDDRVEARTQEASGNVDPSTAASFFQTFYEIIVGSTKFGPQTVASSVAAYYLDSMPDAIASDTTRVVFKSLTSRAEGGYATFDVVLAVMGEEGEVWDAASTDAQGGPYDRVVVDISGAEWKITGHTRSGHPPAG